MSQQNTPTIPTTGFLRLNQVLKLLPIGKTKWYAGIKSGEYPRPVSLGPRCSAYHAEDIPTIFNRPQLIDKIKTQRRILDIRFIPLVGSVLHRAKGVPVRF